MNTTRPHTAKQLWGIYHEDREYALKLGNPLRTVIEAPTKIAAEEKAASRGFGNPTANPVPKGDLTIAEWPQHRRPGHRSELAYKTSRRQKT